MRARSLQALGAYTFGSITAPLMFALRYIPNVYDVQAIDVSTRAVFTHTAPLSVYRGAGRPEAVYLCERLLDRAAQCRGAVARPSPSTGLRMLCRCINAKCPGNRNPVFYTARPPRRAPQRSLPHLLYRQWCAQASARGDTPAPKATTE